MNAECKHCRLSEFLGSSSALTDCFTSSNLLLIRSVNSDKCGRRHAERGILAQRSPSVYRLRVDHAQLVECSPPPQPARDLCTDRRRSGRSEQPLPLWPMAAGQPNSMERRFTGGRGFRNSYPTGCRRPLLRRAKPSRYRAER